MSEFVQIHGGQLNIDSAKEIIEWARTQNWVKQKWKTRPALISKNSSSLYVGQKFDPTKTDLIEDGWTHDHCEICSWTLHESDDPEVGIGYTTDGHTWICAECFTKFVVKV